MPEPASYHAIYLVLNEFELFEASLRSVYPHITGATVVTSHDRDRYDNPVVPDETLERILRRDLDPDRKVNVLVCTEGSEAGLRNRAMASARLPVAAGSGWAPAPGRARIVAPDWFWIIDADEIYDDAAVARLKDYVAANPARVYRLTADNYWRSWNWRIEQRGSYDVLVAPGVWFGELRHHHLPPWRRAVRKAAHLHLLPAPLATPLLRVREVPRDVAVFHHGSYLGDRRRIEAKLAASGHRDQHLDGWLDRVWDAWTPDMRDLHPIDPPAFPQAHHVATADLPPQIRERAWPSGWLEPP